MIEDFRLSSLSTCLRSERLRDSWIVLRLVKDIILANLEKKGHDIIHLLAVKPWNPGQCIQISFLFKSISLCLSAKQRFIQNFIGLDILTDKQVAKMLTAQHDRCGHVPQIVFTAVGLKGAFWNAFGQLGVTFKTVVQRVRVAAVKLGADILPSRACQDIPINVYDGIGNPGDPVKILHNGRKQINVHNVCQAQ